MYESIEAGRKIRCYCR
jgi:hypothetical protein